MEKKIMHRFKYIQLTEVPINIEEWYKSTKYSKERITVFKLYHMINIDENERVSFLNDFYKHLKKIEKEESSRIQKKILIEEDINKLKDFLNRRKHRELLHLIVERMYSLNENIFKDYLKQLENDCSEDSFDSIVEVLIETMKRKDISNEILEILQQDKIRDPQEFAVLLQIIGLSSNNNVLRYLYTYYNYYINNFPENNYYEGPLFGIHYFIERQRRTTSSS